MAQRVRFARFAQLAALPLARLPIAALAERQEEVERRWSITTSQWPQVNTILYGIDRDQLMARHKSNHIQLAYAPSAEAADLAMAAKAAAFNALGVEVFLCGAAAPENART